MPKHHRRSIRLKGYDYSSPGAYFVTICTQGRECVLDDPVVTGIITDVWHALPGWFPTIELDEFVVMPNHVHFILWIHPSDAVGATLAVAQDRAGARRAGASPAPTDGGCGVGATLAVAQDRAGARRAGASPAPTRGGCDVGATLAVARNAVAQDGAGVGATLASAQDAVVGQGAGASPATPDGWDVGAALAAAQNAIRRCIRLNPDNWALDRDNPDNIRRLSPPETVEDYVREALTETEMA